MTVLTKTARSDGCSTDNDGDGFNDTVDRDDSDAFIYLEHQSWRTTESTKIRTVKMPSISMKMGMVSLSTIVIQMTGPSIRELQRLKMMESIKTAMVKI